MNARKLNQLFGAKLQTPKPTNTYVSNYVIGKARKAFYEDVHMSQLDWDIYRYVNTRERMPTSEVLMRFGLTREQLLLTFDRIKRNRLGFICDKGATHVQTISQWWGTESVRKMVAYVFFQHYVRRYTAPVHRKRLTLEEFTSIAYLHCSGYTRKYTPVGKSSFLSYAQMRLILELADIHAAQFTCGLTGLPNKIRKFAGRLAALRVATEIKLNPHTPNAYADISLLNEVHAREETDAGEGGIIELIRSRSAGLNDNETAVMLGLYCEGLTMKAIGGKLGLSESRVSQIHANVLPRLREIIVRRGLHE